MYPQLIPFRQFLSYSINIFMQNPNLMNNSGSLVGGGTHSLNFYDVICLENLFRAWRNFSRGKRDKRGIGEFELRVEENLFSLHEFLKSGNWTHDPYVQRKISDPKPRIIHIASVRDRVLFQATYQKLYQIFDKTFIHDSYASRNFKGTHAGVKRFEVFARKVSENHTKPAFVLKCDIRKFFDNIDHEILFDFIKGRIKDGRLLKLIWKIVSSFEASPHKGLPLGNVTSQLFANIYLNDLDQLVKHELKQKYYIRYCDDSVMLSNDRDEIEKVVSTLRNYLKGNLKLELHPNKITIRKLRHGTDFLGYVSLPHYRVLRTKTKKRMLKRLRALANTIKTKDNLEKILPIIRSYLGMLSHCRSEKVVKRLKNYWPSNLNGMIMEQFYDNF